MKWMTQENAEKIGGMIGEFIVGLILAVLVIGSFYGLIWGVSHIFASVFWSYAPGVGQ